MSVGEKVLMDQVIKLVRLVLVMLATNAISERSFFSYAPHQNILKVNDVTRALECYYGS